MSKFYVGTYDEYADYVMDALMQAAVACRGALLRLVNPQLPAVIPTDYLVLLYTANLEPTRLLETMIARGYRDVDLTYPMGVQVARDAEDDFTEREFLDATLEFLAKYGGGLAQPAATMARYHALMDLCRTHDLATDLFEEEISFCLALLADADYDCQALTARIAAGNINMETVVPVLVHNFNATTAYLTALLAETDQFVVPA